MLAPTTKNHGEGEAPPLAAPVRKAASSGSPRDPRHPFGDRQEVDEDRQERHGGDENELDAVARGDRRRISLHHRHALVDELGNLLPRFRTWQSVTEAVRDEHCREESTR